jgi:hypothetical protein
MQMECDSEKANIAEWERFKNRQCHSRLAQCINDTPSQNLRTPGMQQYVLGRQSINIV